MQRSAEEPVEVVDTYFMRLVSEYIEGNPLNNIEDQQVNSEENIKYYGEGIT